MSDTTKTPRCFRTDCEMPAEWRIKITGGSTEERTDACVQHVGEILQVGKLCTVYSLKASTDLGGLICSPSCVDAGIKRAESMKQDVRDMYRSFDEYFSGKTVEEVWDEFWREIVCNDDGSMNVEQVKKELYDFSRMMRNTTRVFCHVTGDTISKPLTDAKAVCQLADEHYSAFYEQSAKDDALDNLDFSHEELSLIWSGLNLFPKHASIRYENGKVSVGELMEKVKEIGTQLPSTLGECLEKKQVQE